LKSVGENPDKYLATATEMLMAEGMTEAAELLRTTTPKVEETGYDNWNGGTTIWTIYLAVEPSIYVALGSKREILEDQIGTRLKAILERFTQDWFGVKITPKVDMRPDWRHAKGDLSREVRQNIIDGLRLENVRWSGRLEEVEFLQRLYDLSALPSTDSRYKDAAGDIWQHRVNNPLDWDDDWVYSDDRFELLGGSTDMFLRFLAEMVHPVVRPDRNEVLKLVQHFNDQLQMDGWSLVEEEKIAGRPRFIGKRIRMGEGRSAAVSPVRRWVKQSVKSVQRATSDNRSVMRMRGSKA